MSLSYLVTALLYFVAVVVVSLLLLLLFLLLLLLSLFLLSFACVFWLVDLVVHEKGRGKVKTGRFLRFLLKKGVRGEA